MRRTLFHFVAAVSMSAASMVSAVQAAVVSFGSFSGEFVTVGDPGNTADSTGFGAVAETFNIMKYEVTNAQYGAFLNSVAKTDNYFFYNALMAEIRGGIERSGVSGAYAYTVKAIMSEKPVNHVSWFDAARYCNWLHNGATNYSSTEFGAYTLNGTTSGNAVALNAGAKYFIPSENQWYKAAYYKGGSTNAGYWNFATQSDYEPNSVRGNPNGDGAAGSLLNSANFTMFATWNHPAGNVTTVGTNGGPSYYGTFDMSGNIREWNDLDGTSGPLRLIRGGNWLEPSSTMKSGTRFLFMAPNGEFSNNDGVGFRVASLSSSAPPAVPEPSMMVIGTLFGIGGLVARRRMKK